MDTLQYPVHTWLPQVELLEASHPWVGTGHSSYVISYPEQTSTYSRRSLCSDHLFIHHFLDSRECGWERWVLSKSKWRQEDGCLLKQARGGQSWMLSVFLDHTHLIFWDKKKSRNCRRALKTSIVHSTIEHARTTWGLWDGLVGKGLASEPEDRTLIPRTHMKRRESAPGSSELVLKWEQA